MFGAPQARGFERGSLITMSAAGGGLINETSDELSKNLMEDSDDEIGLDKDADLKEKPVAKFKPLTAYMVLGLILMVRILVQWHRKGLTYAYGYTGLGAASGNPAFEIATAYP